MFKHLKLLRKVVGDECGSRQERRDYLHAARQAISGAIAVCFNCPTRQFSLSQKQLMLVKRNPWFTVEWGSRRDNHCRHALREIPFLSCELTREPRRSQSLTRQHKELRFSSDFSQLRVNFQGILLKMPVILLLILIIELS
jgi:hypothetical protein